MSPIQEQQIIGLFIEARIKQEAAAQATDALDLAIFRAGNPKFHIRLIEEKPQEPKPGPVEEKPKTPKAEEAHDEKGIATS